MKELRLGSDPKICISDSSGYQIEEELYSSGGKNLIDTLALKQSVYFKSMYEHSWLGVKIIQFPADMVAYQEIIYEVRPNVIVETGIAHGGSLIYSASLQSILAINSPRVLGIDIDIRHQNRLVIEDHPLAPCVHMFEGSSTSSAALDFVASHIRPDDTVLVVLDSSHLRDHVAAELDVYSHFVSVGSYILAMDGALGLVGDVPGQSLKSFDDNPLAAIDEFLSSNDEFIESDWFDRLGVTSSPRGALKRVI